jgi:glutamate carboxypeptidase
MTRMSPPTPEEASALRWLADQQASMVALLERLVNVDSGSRNKAGVDQVGDLICEFLNGQGISYEVIRNPQFGDAIRARVGVDDHRRIVVLGHRDTVFPDGEARQRPFRIDGGRGYGPGVADMKAGLVMNCFVAAAISRFIPRHASVVLLFTADEEIGSPSSRFLIEGEAPGAMAVFNSEPGRPTGAVVTGRKAGIFMRCEVQGKAAHAGVNFDKGVSAVLELAHKIAALSVITDLARGITLNVGLISGGQTVNTVPPTASAEIDLRYMAASDREGLMNDVKRVVENPFVAGTRATFQVTAEFLPLVQTPANLRLFEFYRECAQALGITVAGEFTGGCSDAGFSSSTGVPTLCGVGPVGALAHSDDEYVEIGSILTRAQMLTLTISRLAMEWR